MEDKQLDFNQPLLSVRRSYNTATTLTEKTKTYNNSGPGPPPYRTQLKSGPITNPGSVPFQWEHTPGQPKDQHIIKPLNSDRPPIAPKLPPGRHHLHVATHSNSPTAQYQHENVQNIKEKTEEEEESSDSGDIEGAYVDALDTLSITESFFFNCSTSGLSGLDDVQIKPSGSFKTDRDFMLDRFLPAAKAMASEMPPQYAPRKQPVVREQLKKVVGNQDKPSLRYGPSFAKRYSHYHDNDDEEEESDVEENLPAVCGLLPRFCLKSSLCLLNPVPAMTVRTRVPMSQAHIIQTRSLSSSETENESKSDISELKSIDKTQKAAAEEDKTKGFGLHGNGFKTFEELLVDQSSDSGGLIIKKTLYVDSVKKVESPILTSFSPYTCDTKGVPGSREEDHEIITKRADQMHVIDGEAKLPLNGEFNILSSIDESKKKWGMKMPKGFGENMEVTEKERIESIEKQQSRGNYNENYSKFPVPPPLPKSPSDSWLWHTLPSMSTKNLSLRTYLGSATNPQNQGSKSPTNDMKWETIVKTTNEMLMTIPET